MVRRRRWAPGDGSTIANAGLRIPSFTLHPAGIPLRSAPGHRGSLHGQGGDRGAGGHGVDTFHPAQDHPPGGRDGGRPLPRADGSWPRTPPARPANSQTVDRRRSRTEGGSGIGLSGDQRNTRVVSNRSSDAEACAKSSGGPSAYATIPVPLPVGMTTRWMRQPLMLGSPGLIP